MGDDRAPVYYEGSKLVIRASAIGHPCMWELIAAGQGVDSSGAPAWMKRAFQEGHDAEPLIVRFLQEAHAFEFESHQEQGELVLWKSADDLSPVVVMRYHPDGIANVPDLFMYEHTDCPEMIADYKTVVVEIKNLSDGLWQQAVRHGVESTIADYKWQLSGMMIKENLPGLWVCRNKGKRVKGVKVPCADEGKYYYQYVPEPLVRPQAFYEKGWAIKEGVDGEDLLTSDRPCDDINHFPCLYRHVRPEPEEELLKDNEVWLVPEELEETVDEDAKEYVYLKGQIAEMSDRLEAARDRLVARAPEGVKAIQTSKWRVPVRDSHATGYKWDEMPQALKDQLAEFKKSGKTGRHIRDLKRLD